MFNCIIEHCDASFMLEVYVSFEAAIAHAIDIEVPNNHNLRFIRYANFR